MTPAALLHSLESAGLALRPAEDGHLLVSPAGQLTPDQRAAVAACRDDLLALLRERAETEELDRYVVAMCRAGAWRLPQRNGKWGW